MQTIHTHTKSTALRYALVIHSHVHMPVTNEAIHQLIATGICSCTPSRSSKLPLLSVRDLLPTMASAWAPRSKEE